MDSETTSPGGVFDASRPNPARVYDALLDGKDNFEADRRTAADLAQRAPEVYQAVHANRAFLVRAVRYLAQQGIRQYIDLGSGFPTSPNVHEVARRTHPDAKVVYVDHDPVVVAHGRAFNAADKTAILHGDLRDPDRILEQRNLYGLIDRIEPVAVLAVAVLHFLDDNDSAQVVSRFRQAMAPGSYLVVSHGSHGTRDDIEETADTYRQSTADVWVRTPEEIRAYFGDLEMVEPGLVPVQDWRPDGAPALVDAGAPRAVVLGGVARVPEGRDE